MFSALPPAHIHLSPIKNRRQRFCSYLSAISLSKGTNLPAVHQPHWNFTTTRFSRSRPHCLRRLLIARTVNRRKYHYVFCCHRLRHDCSHTVRVLKASIAMGCCVKRSLLWLVRVGHRRNVKELLVLCCRDFDLAMSFFSPL